MRAERQIEGIVVERKLRESARDVAVRVLPDIGSESLGRRGPAAAMIVGIGEERPPILLGMRANEVTSALGLGHRQRTELVRSPIEIGDIASGYVTALVTNLGRE